MRIHRHWEGIAPGARGASVALGNFDGVHLGHQHVIDLARQEATRLGKRLGIITFEPHPRQYFAPNAAPFRLMNSESRANRLSKLAVEELYELPFDQRIAEMSPQGFAHTILELGLGVSHVVIGRDFRFGKGREGDVQDLTQFGQDMGFGVTVADLLLENTQEVSSTAIRLALREGRPRDAKKMLGHWHRIEGKVQHGEKRGRDLGYPTANMSIDGLHPPKFGIYAVEISILTGSHKGIYHGAASLGIRPMFGENRPNLETHIFDFSGNIYDETASVALIEYLRPELKFDTLDALILQMEKDCRKAREALQD